MIFRKNNPATEGSDRPPGKPLFGWWDALFTFVVLGAAVGFCQPFGDALAREADAKRQELRRVSAVVRDAETRSEANHTEREQLRQLQETAARLAAALDSRQTTPLPTALAEISQHRPPGVAAEWVAAYGPNFKMQITAEHPELVGEYVERLSLSPVVRQVIPPARNDPAGNVAFLHGSFVGQ